MFSPVVSHLEAPRLKMNFCFTLASFQGMLSGEAIQEAEVLHGRLKKAR